MVNRIFAFLVSMIMMVLGGANTAPVVPGTETEPEPTSEIVEEAEDETAEDEEEQIEDAIDVPEMDGSEYVEEGAVMTAPGNFV